MRERKRRKAVREVLKRVEVNMKIEEIRRVRRGVEKGEGMIVVKTTKEEQKEEILRKKSN